MLQRLSQLRSYCPCTFVFLKPKAHFASCSCLNKEGAGLYKPERCFNHLVEATYNRQEGTCVVQGSNQISCSCLGHFKKCLHSGFSYDLSNRTNHNVSYMYFFLVIYLWSGLWWEGTAEVAHLCCLWNWLLWYRKPYTSSVCLKWSLVPSMCLRKGSSPF